MTHLLYGFLTLVLSVSSAYADPQRIIGDDTRYRITNANAVEAHDSIGLLSLRFGDKMYQCTGTVIGTRHVLTSAHCLLDEHAKKADLVVFYPGLRENINNKKYPFSFFRSTKFKLHPEYAKYRNTDTDLAVVEFSENLPVKPLRIGISINGHAKIKIAGYPGDKVTGEMWEGSGNRFRHFIELNPDSHNVDTMGGQSGAALRVGNLVIGVHSAGVSGILYNYNVAHMFNSKTLALISSWINN